jgi:hypothetical protein
MKHSLERPIAAPLLEAAMTGLIRRVAAREILPGSTRAQNPENPVQHIPRIPPRTPSTIRPRLRLRKQRLYELPLGFGEVHAVPLRGGWGHHCEGVRLGVYRP